jgi:hypothetical protein
MAYPRSCAACGGSYVTWSGGSNFPHETVTALDGGTPSPWRPERAGRVLDLRCEYCGAVFRWDYFGPGTDAGHLGALVEILRPATGQLTADNRLTSPWAAEGRRRAS